jgi:hypothetical protein
MDSMVDSMVDFMESAVIFPKDKITRRKLFEYQDRQNSDVGILIDEI